MCLYTTILVVATINNISIIIIIITNIIMTVYEHIQLHEVIKGGGCSHQPMRGL